MIRPTCFLASGVTLLLLATVSSGCKSNSSDTYGYSTTGPSPTSSPPNTIMMHGFAFSPDTLSVPVGTTVTWKNEDGYTHTSTSDTGVWDTGDVAGGGSASFTFNAAGTYPYHCIYHVSMGMRGVIIVK